MPLARTWLRCASFTLPLLVLLCASLILLASVLLPLDLRLASGFSSFSHSGLVRNVQVVHRGRPGSLVRAVLPEQEMHFFQEMLCMSVDEGIIWEPGNNAEILSRHLRSDDNAMFWVNGLRMTIASGKLTARDTAVMHYSIFDNPEQLTGTMPDVEYCLNTSDLQAGIYTVRLQIAAMSGTTHDDAWFFRIS